MKNYGIDLAEGAEIVNISVPTGTDFPGSPNNGELFYKTSDNVFYGYSNGSWVAISPPGGGGFLALAGGTLTGDLRVNSDIGINRDARTSLDVGGDVLVQPTTAADAYIRLRHGSSSVNSGLKSDSSGTLTAFTNDNVNAFSINTTGVVTFVNDPYVGANKIWHQGNDGAASGLDADLLDGQSGAYYLDWTNTTNKPDPVITLNGDVTGSGTMTDLGSVNITTTNTFANMIYNGTTEISIPVSDGPITFTTDGVDRITIDENGNLTVIGSIYNSGIGWTTRVSAADNNWWDVCYGNGLFVAVAVSGTGNRVMTSPDGINWTSRTSAADQSWESVAYGNGLFVAVAGVSPAGGRVMTSPDGITWTQRTSANDLVDWETVCYGNSLFVAVSSSNVMTSPDGITWTSRSSPNAGWNSVCYGNGLYVAVGSSGTGNRVMTSPDGITWTSRTSAVDNSWWDVCYGNGLFVAVAITGTGNRVMTSPDGITWTSRTSAADNDWVSISYGNGLFVAVAITGTGNRVMTSPDGISWATRTSAADIQWRGVSYGNGLFVSVASTGTGNRVMTSGAQDASNDQTTAPPIASATQLGGIKEGSGVSIAGDGTLDADVLSVNGMTGPVVVSTITGNAGTASTLQTSRSISITGDATWSVNFDGSANVSSGLTLSNSGVSAGTYNNSATQTIPFTVDAKGRITTIGAGVTITPHWNSITNTPTTLSGYGITDAASSAGTTYVGTTEIGLNRASANQALTGILSVAMPGSTSGTITIIPTAIAGSNTITFPAVTGNVVTTGDTATVTNTMLAGSIANAKLVNSSVTVGSTNIALGATSTTLAGLTSINGLVLTANATGFSIAGGTTSKTLTMSNTLTFSGTDSSSVNFGAGGTVAYTGGTLAQFAATTSAQLASVISDETGSGVLVFGTSPAITTSITTPSTTFSLLNTTATTVNFAGEATTINIGGGSGTTLIGHNLSVVGNLTVNGTTTTVNSTVVSLDDPILTLGGDTAPVSDDNKDRGIEFRWHNGTSAKVGFFGFDDSTGKFTFIPDATNTSEVFSGTKGTLDAYIDWANLTNIPSPTITLSGAVSGSGTLSASGGINITTSGGSISSSQIYNGTSSVDIPVANDDIIFSTAGSIRSRINESGQLSIETNSTTPSDGSVYLYKSTAGAVISGYQVQLETGSAGSRAIALTADFNGNVGIRTASPNSTLHVVNPVATTNSQVEIGSGNGYSSVRLNGNGTSKNWIIGTQYNNSATFEITPSTTNGGSTFIGSTPAFVVSDNLNVGIGTTSPGSKLHVKGGAGTNIRVESTADTDGNIRFINTLSDFSCGITGANTGYWYIHDNVNNEPVYYYVPGASSTQIFYTDGTERLRIDNTGKVGINNNSPSATLDVAGTVKVSGTIAIGSNGNVVTQYNTLTTSATTPNQVVLTFAAASYRTAKFLIQVTSGSSYHSTEIVVIHDGTTTYLSEYGTIMTGSSLAEFDSDISGGNVRLLVTPTNAVTVIKVSTTVIEI